MNLVVHIFLKKKLLIFIKNKPLSWSSNMIPPSEEQMQYMCNYIPEGRATRLKVCISLTFSSPSTLPSLWC